MNKPRVQTIAFGAMVNLISVALATAIYIPLLRPYHLRPETLAYFPVLTSLLLSVVFSFLLRNPAERSLTDLVEATKKISKGDYTVRVRESGNGEMLEFSRSFNRMTAELGETELMRSDFINSFSHEFRTPINAVSGFAERLLRGGLEPETQREYLIYIMEESRRLANLSESILTVSRFSRQTTVREMSDFDLDEQIRRCVLSFQNQWEKKNIRFDLSLPRFCFHGNEEMTEHIWRNLIGNAIKFSLPGSTVYIAGETNGDGVEISVRDEGIGMDEETKKHIFEQFYQGDPAHASEGCGLGLALVKRVVELCGGTIAVESAPGAGSTFSVFLPVR